MESWATSCDETKRLAALHHYRILDTYDEGFFGKIVNDLARQFHFSIAGIALVDGERQWSKAVVGMPRRCIPRRHGFCTYAIQSEQPLVVPDARLDARFRHMPKVQLNGGIRGYAAAPLIDRHGYRIGAVCVADTTPRRFRPAQVDGLQAVARRVMRHIELHRLRLLHQTRLWDFLLRSADDAHARADARAAADFIELTYALLDEEEYDRGMGDACLNRGAVVH